MYFYITQHVQMHEGYIMEPLQQDAFQQFIAYFLATFYSIVAVFYTIIIKLRGSQQCDASLVNMGKKHSLHWWNHVIFRVFRVAIWLMCMWYAFEPSVAKYLFVFTDLLHPVVQFVGAILMLLGFSLTIYCNFILDEAWRSGVDEESKPGLVTRLLYARSRNPSYIGVAYSQFGFFMAWPNIFSLVCLIVGLVALRIQIALEETFLNDMYNEEYQRYISKVPRYF